MANGWQDLGKQKQISVGILRVKQGHVIVDLRTETQSLIFDRAEVERFIGELQEALKLSYDWTIESRRTDETS